MCAKNCGGEIRPARRAKWMDAKTGRKNRQKNFDPHFPDLIY
jgi:hypothetical protein